MVLKLSKNVASFTSLDVASMVRVNGIERAGRRYTTAEAPLDAEKEDTLSILKEAASEPDQNITPRSKRPRGPYIPALDTFPTLRRFHDQEHHPFRPRDNLIPPGIKLPTSRLLVSQKLNHLYHDLGVTVFAGTTDQQTESIGYLLRHCMNVPGGLPKWWRRAYDRKGRYRVYRLGLEDLATVHGDGPLTGSELTSLAELVAQRLCTDVKEKLEEVPEKGPFEFKLLDYLGPKDQQFNLSLRAVTHPTVNGPRRLPIRAYVCPVVTSEHIELNVEFFSVGTDSYLGSAKRFVGDPIAKDQKRTAALLSHLRFWQRCRQEGVDSIMLKTLDLEEQVWAKQWKQYDSAQGKRERLWSVKKLHRAILMDKLALRNLINALKDDWVDVAQWEKKADEALSNTNIRLGVFYPKEL